ncbi:MAG: tryptophan synthase subunit alpha [Bacteroidetes bacterium]|nr:tryptophan synthase subunit alpha [Bacteroidota bacterium]
MTHTKKGAGALMGHLVLGYPTLQESIRTAEKYVEGGVEILELQIPFSHPTADGPVITAACREAVEQQRVSMQDCLEALQTIRQRFPDQEIMVMSYVNRVYAFGPRRFAEAMERLNIRHLIIPDLPVDDAQALAITRHANIKLVPVLAANATDARLEKLLAAGFDFYYLMSDFKITGSTFSLHPRLQKVIGQIKQTAPEARVGIGFGISTPEQVQMVYAAADVAIIGSALIRAQEAGGLETYLSSVGSA